ncbi:MAG: hypothetical protein Q9191_006608 [Dirinaria sp. TL-2023a]
MHSLKTAANALAALALLSASASAHSWIEQLDVIAPNGTFTGAPGFARGNVQRQGNAAVDKSMVYLLPPDGRDPTQGVLPSDTMCFPGHQQQQTQTAGSPRLNAAPGDMVALRYQENGHVTLPQNQPGKPENRGTIYVYGTTQSSPDDKFLDIFNKWNTDGSGGNKKGKLLATFNYDDGQCYQVNGGAISQSRQKQDAHTADQTMGADLWCQNDLQLPTDAPSGKPYTLYWVWNWPTAPGTPGVPNGKLEFYTTCMDINVNGQASNNKAESSISFKQGQNLDSAGVAGQISAIAAGKPLNAPTALPAGEKLAGSGNANSEPAAATTAPAASTPPPAPAASPAPQAPAPAPQAPAPAPQAPAPAPQAPPPAAASPPAAKTVTDKVTVTVQASSPSSPVAAKSTKMVTLPKSTKIVQPTALKSAEPGVPTISLSDRTFSGTATPVAQPTGGSGNATSTMCKKNKRSKIFGAKAGGKAFQA